MAVLITIHSNGSRPAVNGEGIAGEGAGSVSASFARKYTTTNLSNNDSKDIMALDFPDAVVRLTRKP